MSDLAASLEAVRRFLDHVALLHERLAAGRIAVNVPVELLDPDWSLEEAVAAYLPASHAALEEAAQGLFYSLPVAFDPAESIGPYLATVDRDPEGEPYRFLDLGAQIATHPYGENDPDLVAAVLAEPAYAVSRFAHCEYQTALSLRLKARLDAIAPRGTPRHFVVNTGAEAVENAMKAVLLSRVRASEGTGSGYFVISFDGAFHGRTLGALAVTQRKRARAGFPTFDWPHVPFPGLDPDDPADTDRREERSLREVWELIVTGRLPTVPRGREAFRRDLEVVDALLASAPEDLEWRLERAQAQVAPDVQQRARRVAGILVEPIQGEGGVRVARPDFFRRLRLLSALYEVPLIFDEVQCGGGITGTRWAHDRFDLPLPPDAVTWAKSAQNGVLFVSEELATFFQEEKKFNTTWEGDSVGMLRLLALLDRLDLDQARRTGQAARALLEEVVAEGHALVHGVRGEGCMLGFDVARSDLRDAIRERAFRRGLILLPAGERTLRFYPRLDLSEGCLREAVGLLRQAIDDVANGRTSAAVSMPERRVGAFDVPRSRQQLAVFDAEGFEDLRDQIEAVEEARYGSLLQYPPEARSAGVRPLLAYPLSVLAASIGSPGAFGVAVRDSVSRRLVGYAIAGALESFDEEGVNADPHLGEGTVVYLQALATLPSVKNHVELSSLLLEAVRERAIGLGYRYLSSLIEAQVREAGPPWLRAAEPLRTLESYLGSGIRFVYLQVPIAPEPG